VNGVERSQERRINDSGAIQNRLCDIEQVDGVEYVIHGLEHAAARHASSRAPAFQNRKSRRNQSFTTSHVCFERSGLGLANR